MNLTTRSLHESHFSEARGTRTVQQDMLRQLLANLQKLQEDQVRTQENIQNLNESFEKYEDRDSQKPRYQLDLPSSHERDGRVNPPRTSQSHNPSAIVGLMVQRVSKPSCQPSCSCKCHVKGSWRSHPIFDHVIGSLFVGYSRSPKLVPSCDTASCIGNKRGLAVVFYAFPQWFLQLALLTVISYSKRDGLGVALRSLRRRDAADDVFYYAQSGHVASMRTIFERGQASPFDVRAVDDSSPLKVHMPH